MISWTDELSTGVVAIDDDHKFLVTLINTFAQMAECGALPERLGAAIEALGEYADNHFRREEALMMVCGYTLLRPHQKSHELFAEIVGTLGKLYGLCPVMIDINGVAQFLSHWFLDHIAITDRDYLDQMGKHKDVIDRASQTLQNDHNFIL